MKGTPGRSLWHQSETKWTGGAEISDRQQLQDGIIELLIVAFTGIKMTEKDGRSSKRRSSGPRAALSSAPQAHNEMARLRRARNAVSRSAATACSRHAFTYDLAHTSSCPDEENPMAARSQPTRPQWVETNSDHRDCPHGCR